MRAVTEDESHTDTDESESEESHDGVITDIQHSGQDTLTSVSLYHDEDIWIVLLC